MVTIVLFISLCFCALTCFHLQHKLKSSQKDKVKQFMGFTQANEKTAIMCLSQSEWRLDLASDRYFQNIDAFRDTHVSRQPPADCKKIEQLFNYYRGSASFIIC